MPPTNGLAAFLTLCALAPAQARVRFDRDIRPILSERCFRCHGPDSASREAELRLDVAEDATRVRDEFTAIVPGKPEQSELWRRVTCADPEDRMPPAEAKRRPLSREELETLRRWIAQGAAYEPHWSFVPPQRPPVPETASAWPRNPIDRFVLAALARHGLGPSPEAERETLLRRVFLDLTGLPPTPQELDAFLADRRPDAYERLVDRLLTEEPYVTRYGERMATPWLDAARYADTIGIHTDAGRSIWPYRDWVVQAYRTGLPFDRFVTEQIAGDLLPNATLPQKVASGFHRCQVQTDEGGAINEEYLVEYAVERVATTGAVFLGMTLGCARCHDHKFDPFTQQDFYSLFAFFNSIDEPGLFSQQPDPKRAHEPALQVPTAAQEQRLLAVKADAQALRDEVAKSSPEDDLARAKWRDALEARVGLRWAAAAPTSVKASGATLAIEKDGSVFASGPNPERDVHEVRLATDATGLRLVAIEALADPRLPKGRVGRNTNGNAVLTEVEATAASKADPSRTQKVRFSWAWADHEQQNGDHVVLNVIDGSRETGWAADGHRRPGGRVLLLLAQEPFGFEGGTEVAVTLRYESGYPQHALGRVRVSLAALDAAASEELPVAQGAWRLVGPFAPVAGQRPYDTQFGPETDVALDLQKNFGAGNQYWRFAESVKDGVPVSLQDGVQATYLGRRIVVPTARKLSLSLGSDDAIRLWLDGKQVLGHDIERGVKPDQERVDLEVGAGPHVLVAKVVNTGGLGGFYYRKVARDADLDGDLMLALAPPSARTEHEKRLERAWRMVHSPAYAATSKRLAALEQDTAKLEAEIPRTMVMKELDKPRGAWVLTRGQYDKPDKGRPAPRAVPAWLGRLPDDAPKDRLGLARWLVSEGNPLVARVAVNRIWEQLFATGIVATSEDFGHQGDWPSHEELLDWLAVTFREGGWDTKALVRTIVTSATYRQGSRVREAAREKDPDNRLLAYFPRKRLSGEQIRDQALYVSGLLVERVGGPAVKPYQPKGLWEEVAMTQSNTRNFVRGNGEDLWRRSLYTFWKRASPPPALLAFDAPTREACTVRRAATSTPLQALVLWNDVQLVEAARVLAQRTLAEKPANDAETIVTMHRRVTGRFPSDLARGELEAALSRFRARFAKAPDAADKLLLVGDAKVPPDADRRELASLTLLANALLNLDATLCRD